MKTEIHLDSNPCNNKILIGGMDVTNAIFAVTIEADALSAPTTTLRLAGPVEVKSNGGKVILEYEHEVKKFFKGRAFEDPVEDVKDG